MGNKNGKMIYRPKTREAFSALHENLTSQRYMAIDALKPGLVRSLTLGENDPSLNKASDLAACIGSGAWSNGPLSKVAWAFDERENTVVPVKDRDGKQLGLGYVKWGPGNCTPSVIPPLAYSSPYTAAPLRYIADLTAGLGPKLMYRFADGTLVEFKDAGERLKARVRDLEKRQSAAGDVSDDVNGVISLLPGDSKADDKKDEELKEARQALYDWERTWYGYDETDDDGNEAGDPGAKAFLENNNLNLHISQCMQDDVMLDIYFPTVGLQRGRRGKWDPRIVEVSMLPSHSTRLGRMNEFRHINHCYFSDTFRTLGATTAKVVSPTPDKENIVMYPAAMPQHLLKDLRYIVDSNQRTRIKDRPTWVVCPTFYPSLNKPYYPQPAWWSVFTSKAFDFSSTILYDKAKQRENNTTWGRVIYLSLDYLDMCFSDQGIAGDKEAQQKFIDELDQNVEEFLQQRENNGKMMRQFMWLGQDGKDHHNVEIVDVKETTNDAVKAGKEELELSTNPMFLAFGVDPRDVGVPMVSASNGGTALREIRLMKQQLLNVRQRMYIRFLQDVFTFNRFDPHLTPVIRQMSFTTLDRNPTGTVETIAGEGA